MNKRYTSILLLLIAALFFTATRAQAQLSGHNSRGDYGLQSGSQAAPGLYLVAPMYYHYSADEFHDRSGDRFSALDGGGSIEASAWLTTPSGS